MNLNAWAIEWGVSHGALADLRTRMGAMAHYETQKDGKSEAAIQSRVMLEASQKGIWLLRNNVGAGKLTNGRFMRWGLANESKAQNTILKSSDLIGIKPVRITAPMVGTIFGQFIARETKEQLWSYADTPHERAQLAFMWGIISRGGDAAFANKVGTL